MPVLKPLLDRVVIKQDAAEEKTQGGIVIPAKEQEKPQQGTVIAAGPGAKNEDGTRASMDLTVGAKVLFPKFAGTEVSIFGEDFRIISEKDVLATIE